MIGAVLGVKFSLKMNQLKTKLRLSHVVALIEFEIFIFCTFFFDNLIFLDNFQFSKHIFNVLKKMKK
jgi:hypothetical protein